MRGLLGVLYRRLLQLNAQNSRSEFADCRSVGCSSFIRTPYVFCYNLYVFCYVTLYRNSNSLYTSTSSLGVITITSHHHNICNRLPVTVGPRRLTSYTFCSMCTYICVCVCIVSSVGVITTTSMSTTLQTPCNRRNTAAVGTTPAETPNSTTAETNATAHAATATGGTTGAATGAATPKIVHQTPAHVMTGGARAKGRVLRDESPSLLPAPTFEITKLLEQVMCVGGCMCVREC